MSLSKSYQFELSNSLERMLKNKEQVEAVKESLKFARTYLNLLVNRIDKEIDDKIKEDENIINYDSPNWALQQAERLGYRRAMRKIKEIIRPIEE